MMEDEASKKRTTIVHGLAQAASDQAEAETGAPWDLTPLTIAHELRTYILNTLGDEGKGCDSGGGDGIADLHPWIGGREYHIQIKPSRAHD